MTCPASLRASTTRQARPIGTTALDGYYRHPRLGHIRSAKVHGGHDLAMIRSVERMIVEASLIIRQFGVGGGEAV